MDERERPPTIYDVARAAGVAASTVSRAFSRPGRVNGETAQRIREVAAELGYRTNPLARALPTGRTGMIALVISDVTNPFYSEIIRGAQTAAAEAGFLVLLVDAQESDRLEREALDRALPTLEGVILASSRTSDSAIRMVAKQRPVVVLNRAVSDVPSIVADTAHGVQLALDHLVGLGHRSVTYLAGPAASWVDGMRWRSLLDLSAQLPVAVHRVGPCPPTVAGGAKAAQALDPVATSAVIAYNDQTAIGLIRGLQARGVRVPQDLSVVGFDNIFAADLVTPGLTTVAAPLRALGENAVRTLLAVLGGAQPRTAEPAVLPTRLVVRGSTAQRSRKRTSPASGTTRVSGSARSAATSTSEGSR
ncbi:LacI family DNA-binding transcriptional regulator [Kitasatospora viridis]|uniref:LacI family transcriptional regulator n=1 Tax=Kitasatospora viridis TaxID=281105 RepID=A0A561TWG1_9ACTN|nr:LacI family DNA-binding transcriptional regulator [Kitasatospora viridis]TWF91442.1 LacI family transcriptional regulator [Kitasatospora viridis]